MILPELNNIPTSRIIVDAFKGYNHNTRIGEAEFYDMKNLTSDHFPVLSPRSPRENYSVEGTPYVMIQEGEKFCYATEDSFYIRNSKVTGLVLDPLYASSRSLVAFGSYIIIFPDRKFVNVNNPEEYGDIDASFTSSGEVSFELCKADGSAYSDATVSDTEPENPANQQLWIDTSASPHTLKQFSAASGKWVDIATTYVKISASGIGAAFEQYDGVDISGIESEALTDLNRSMVIWDKGDDYIVVIGILDKVIKQTSAITISRKMPELDFVVCSGNRLWGCRYHTDREGNSINEIRCSKLGDFKNWNCFMGISTDSYTVSLGESGRFTGATVHSGYPMFFRENCIHKVYGETPSQFQIQNTLCDGVGYNCHKSIVSMNGTLFYKSNTCVCAYDGSSPVNISNNLGDISNKGAVGGRLGEKYYICIGNPGPLFVYDTSKGFWHKEDENSSIVDFCNSYNKLRFIEATMTEVEGGEPVLSRVIKDISPKAAENGSEEVEWMAETGIWGVDSPDKKYVSRLSVRMSLAIGSVVSFYAQYDSSDIWEFIGTVAGVSLKTFTVPLRPKRCDHFRLRIEGVGDAKIFSIAKTIEEGSDV